MNTTNVVTFGERAWLETMLDKDWPTLFNFVAAFMAGIAGLTLLHLAVYVILERLRKKGDVCQRQAEREVALSGWIAGIEQMIFYFAAITGTQVFGFAVTGWFVLKAVSSYNLWNVSDKITRETLYEALSARAHNRRQIFQIGTLMSVTAGGLAGFVYHLIVHIKSG
jgi:hypothetical protein